MIDDLKLRQAGAKRKDEGVAVLFLLRDGSGVDGLSAGGHCHALVDGRTIGKVELEALVVHLRARRLGIIGDREKADALQFVALSLEAHDVSSYADTIDPEAPCGDK